MNTKTGGKSAGTSLITKNKKAYFDYEILEKFEAGIILTGAEVKSIKSGGVQLKGSYVAVGGGKVVVENMHISPYRQSAAHREGNYDPTRRRELLLHKKEINYLSGLTAQKGQTIIPLEIFLKNNLIKVLLGVCRGKKAHDKRGVLKKRAETREIDLALKKFNR